MTEKEILLQACEKAIKQGYTPPIDMQIQMGIQGYRWDLDTYPEWFPRVIFSHNFAKAFFGDKLGRLSHKDIEGNTLWKKIPAWQYHLQQMVLEENPIKYLEKCL